MTAVVVAALVAVTLTALAVSLRLGFALADPDG